MLMLSMGGLCFLHNLHFYIFLIFKKFIFQYKEETDVNSMLNGEFIDFNSFLQNRQDKWAREQSG